MVAALTCHLQALGLGELTHCLRLCSKILSKVQPPLVSPLALPSGSQAQGLSSSKGNPTNSAMNRDKEDQRVRDTVKKYRQRTRLLTELLFRITYSTHLCHDQRICLLEWSVRNGCRCYKLNAMPLKCQYHIKIVSIKIQALLLPKAEKAPI